MTPMDADDEVAGLKSQVEALNIAVGALVGIMMKHRPACGLFIASMQLLNSVVSL
jgi:hypothetical protein